MRKLIGLIATGTLTLLLVGSAYAQLPGLPIRASIPFDFTVRGRTLPAGEYEVTRINDEPEGLLLRNIHDKHDDVVFVTEPKDARKIPNHNLLIFNRYGERYFLSEVVTAGVQTGQELTPSHAERALRREMLARNQYQPETVTVASN
jgi:hypothetical protein